MARALGCRLPESKPYADKYPFSLLVEPQPFTVNRVMHLPWWHKRHDQSSEGSCVGHGAAMERAITNTRQNVLALSPLPRTKRYNPIHLWNRAKEVDQWPDTNPGDANGTSVVAAYDILRDEGAQEVKGIKIVNGVVSPNVGNYLVELSNGVTANRWATTTDEIRFAILNGTPVTIGVNWYSNFDQPWAVKIAPKNWIEYWIGENDLGHIRGGHCVTIYGASDNKQAFKVKNSWGSSYPVVWLPYTTMQRLLNEDGEACLSTDR